ncbi:DUF86 domain-containing protein [Jiella sp. M17.18]|uniref:HepT-like ribonuclease domain-containing protein n=1 Tax=Jiella sp. M17.18 TaxID=3234247 RepID=UPI0034DE1A3F
MAASKTPLVRLFHIRDECEGVARFIAGSSLEELEGDYIKRRATERAIGIISEAAAALPRDLTDRYLEIDWRAIRGMGNVLRHEYQHVETPVLLDVVRHHLPVLAATVARMIADQERSPKP